MATEPAYRHDLYALSHKGLRLCMTDTLQRVGRLDVYDPNDCRHTLAQLNAMQQLCQHHQLRESEVLHPVLEAARPGCCQQALAEHLEQLEALAALEMEVEDLRQRRSTASARRMTQRLTRFITHQLDHMLEEELRLNPVLWEHCSDAELEQLQRRLLGGLPSDELMGMLRWVAPACTPSERAALLGAMPKPLRDAALDWIQPHLDNRAWAKLTLAIGATALPQFPQR